MRSEALQEAAWRTVNAIRGDGLPSRVAARNLLDFMDLYLTELVTELKLESEAGKKRNQYSPYPTDADYWPAGKLISTALIQILSEE